MCVVMGIDASYRSTGIAIISSEGLLYTGKIEFDGKGGICWFLEDISYTISDLIDKYDVSYVGMEELNVAVNFKTAKRLLHVQGAIMAAVYKQLSTEVEMYHNATWKSRLGIKNPKRRYEIVGGKKKKIQEYVVVDGKKVKKDIKYSTIITINSLFDLSLGYKDNDIADAIGIAKVLHDDTMRIMRGDVDV